MIATDCPSRRAPFGRSLAALAVVALGTAAGSGPAAALDPPAQRGQSFARTHCAQCHAIGPTGSSPVAEAPPFRTLHMRYPVEDLAESFAEGIVTGHPTMPEWRLDPAQIRDLLAYLKSLEG